MKRQVLSNILKAAVALVGSVTMAGSGHAAVYTYNLRDGISDISRAVDSVMTIDTMAGTGSIIGSSANAAINWSFTGDFTKLTGGKNPNGIFYIYLSKDSTVMYNGTTYNVKYPDQGEVFSIMGLAPGYPSYVQIEWMTALPKIFSDYGKNVASSSTGGVSSVPVPEPGMLGLMALGAVALVWRRRRALAACAG